MNAFLNAKEFKLPVDSFNDILKRDEDLIVLDGSYTSELYQFAPEGTVFNDIWEKKLKGQSRSFGFGDMKEVIQLVEEGKAFVHVSLEGPMSRPEYPCQIIEAERLRYLTVSSQETMLR